MTTLSDKIEMRFKQIEEISYPDGFIEVFDVKDFIRTLKEEIKENNPIGFKRGKYDYLFGVIDKLAGDKLIDTHNAGCTNSEDI